MSQRFQIRHGFLEFFPNSCILDRKSKQEIYRLSEEKIREALRVTEQEQRQKIFKSIPQAKSPGIEFVKSIICINCIHSTCRHRPQSPLPPTQ